jgi:hypothetical protein
MHELEPNRHEKACPGHGLMVETARSSESASTRLETKEMPIVDENSGNQGKTADYSQVGPFRAEFEVEVQRGRVILRAPLEGVPTATFTLDATIPESLGAELVEGLARVKAEPDILDPKNWQSVPGVDDSRRGVSGFVNAIQRQAPNGETVEVQFFPNGDWTVFNRRPTMTSEMVELHPCPFCGCEASVYSADSSGPFWVQCDMCSVRTPDAEYEGNAEIWWNNRFNDPELERLTTAIERIADEARQSADTYGCANCNAHAETARAALEATK